MSRVHPYVPVRTWVRVAAPSLDGRLAAGEDPFSDPVLARRSAELVTNRTRRRIVRGLERVLYEEPAGRLSAAVACDRRAVVIARPALEQLALALRSRGSVQPKGVAIAQMLLTDPCSPLYTPSRPDELYELARKALFALGRSDHGHGVHRSRSDRV